MGEDTRLDSADEQAGAALPADEPVGVALLASEARFQKLFDEADALSIQGYLADGTVVYWNRASEKIYGYTAAEALGGNLLDLIIPDEMSAGVQAAVRHMFETGQGAPVGRLRLRHKDGHRVSVYSSHTVVTVPGQSPVLFCMDADMSSLERAEAELRVAAAAFESQQSMFVTDAQGVILQVNRAFTASTGYTSEDAVGQTPRRLDSARHGSAFYAAMWSALRRDGVWQGEMWARRKNGEEYPTWTTIAAVKDDAGHVSHYISIQDDITERKAAEDAIRYLAFYDPLTDLPNRKLLQERVQHALASSVRNQRYGALLFLDLDDFKTINDTLGHDQGDRLLQEVAGRLKAAVREVDTVARVGGDEFVVMLEGLSAVVEEAAAQAEAVGEKIVAALSQPYVLRDRACRSTPSIGVTLFGEQGVSMDELLKRADLAMYQAKAAGRSTLRFFEPAMQRAVEARAVMELELREALRESQFTLHYQAQVDARGRVTGAEALLRWLHPQRGMVAPAEFIALAEDNGSIVALGRWVLETACERLAVWADQPAMAALVLAVNVSARQFRQVDFVAEVREALQRSGANPARLKLELTESVVLADVEDSIERMRAIEALGVEFSMDDFGTGYSSLAYLARLPLSQLKIDGSFVRHIPGRRSDEIIARTIISMGRGLEMSVMAEGVESERQRVFLEAHGCHAYQGYLFSPPLALADFEALVRGRC